MKRLFFVFLLGSLLGTLSAQTTPRTVSVRVFTNPAIGQFTVDSQMYTGAATFLWQEGTPHTISSIPLQYTNANDVQLRLSGWSDNTSQAKGGNTVTIIATRQLTEVSASVSVNYRVRVQFQPCDTNGQGVSTSAGVVSVGGNILTCDATFYQGAGGLDLQAFPNDHFVFVGWGYNQVPEGSGPKTSIVLDRPAIITPKFTYGKRISFKTNPESLSIYVNGSKTTPLLGGVSTFDFLPGTDIILGAPDVQFDPYGQRYALDKWSFGGGNNVVYHVDTNTNQDLTITANFVKATTVMVNSEPRGLPLVIDGRNNWAFTNFYWGVGSTHKISAPETLTDANGRKYIFRGWSNGGSATQDFKVDPSIADIGFQLVANYELMGRVSIVTDPPGLPITVEGSACKAPCVLDRQSGTAVSASVLSSYTVDDNSKFVFSGWNDATTANRTINFTSDGVTLVAKYVPYYRVVTGSDPANGAEFQLNPAGSDGFFQDGVYLTVNVTPKPGYKFIRLDGEIRSTTTSGGFLVRGPAVVQAILNKVPYIPPAGVRNAAGETPDGTVAPGSLISITGENLAKDLVVAEKIPYSQSLGGTVVRLGDRFLALMAVSPQIINAVLPQDLEDGEYKLIVMTEGNPDVEAKLKVARNAPGLFERSEDDRIFVAAQREDGSLITTRNPASRSEVITLWGTGFGPYDRKPVEGFAIPATPAYRVQDSVVVLVGDMTLQPLSTVAAPGMVGVTWTRVRLTADLPRDTQPTIRVRVNGKESNVSVLPLVPAVEAPQPEE